MEPMKRMSITVAVILILAVLALGVVYMMAKKMGERVEMKSVYEESKEIPPQKEATTESSAVHESLADSETPADDVTTPGAQDVEPSAEAPDAQEPMVREASSSAGQCDVIPTEDISKYLLVKDSVFAVYNDNKELADMMLNQERRWRPEHITSHMVILMELKVKKKQALKTAAFPEKRFHYISNALMEWVIRTHGISYEKKYVGEEDFYSKKIGPIIPCEENDRIFSEHKGSLSKTFMGDFELVDY